MSFQLEVIIHPFINYLLLILTKFSHFYWCDEIEKWFI